MTPRDARSRRRRQARPETGGCLQLYARPMRHRSTYVHAYACMRPNQMASCASAQGRADAVNTTPATSSPAVTAASNAHCRRACQAAARRPPRKTAGPRAPTTLPAGRLPAPGTSHRRRRQWPARADAWRCGDGGCVAPLRRRMRGRCCSGGRVAGAAAGGLVARAATPPHNASFTAAGRASPPARRRRTVDGAYIYGRVFPARRCCRSPSRLASQQCPTGTGSRHSPVSANDNAGIPVQCPEERITKNVRKVGSRGCVGNSPGKDSYKTEQTWTLWFKVHNSSRGHARNRERGSLKTGKGGIPA